MTTPTEPVEVAAGTCHRCGCHTTRGRVHWITRNTAPDARIILHADPADCRPIGGR